MLRRTRLLRDVLEGMKKGQSKGGVRKKMFIIFFAAKKEGIRKIFVDGWNQGSVLAELLR